MNSLIKVVAVALVLSAPLASFAQEQRTQAGADNTQAAPTRAALQNGDVDTSGYGPSGRGSWQAGNSSDTTVSTYSPPIYNVR